MKARDLMGMRFGMLEVVSKAEKMGKLIAWSCKCDCGNTTIGSTQCLAAGLKKSCGCLQPSIAGKRNFKDLVGQKFFRLTVLGRGENTKEGSASWICSCECGKSISVNGKSLRSGNTKSCGCYLIDRIKESRTLDLTGLVVGRLTAISLSGKTGRSNTWLCDCKCGNTKIVGSSALTGGLVISCGCALRDRLGELPEDVRNRAAAASSRRRARKLGAGGSYTADDIDRIYLSQRGKCAGYGCGINLGKKFHRDHKVSLSKGGSNDAGNIELLCPSCNLKKNDKDPIDWANENGRLI